MKIVLFQKKSQALFNILTEPLLVQKQTIYHHKARDLIWSQEDKGVAWSRGRHAYLSQKDIEKKKQI